MIMKLVQTKQEIERNIDQLEKYRHSHNEHELAFYKPTIKGGICFVGSEHNGELVFGPSRFVGYANNTMVLHKDNEDKHGRDTNAAISRILGSEPVENDELEEEYRLFCDKIDVIWKPLGAFGKPRKYWDMK